LAGRKRRLRQQIPVLCSCLAEGLGWLWHLQELQLLVLGMKQVAVSLGDGGVPGERQVSLLVVVVVAVVLGLLDRLAGAVAQEQRHQLHQQQRGGVHQAKRVEGSER